MAEARRIEAERLPGSDAGQAIYGKPWDGTGLGNPVAGDSNDAAPVRPAKLPARSGPPRLPRPHALTAAAGLAHLVMRTLQAVAGPAVVAVQPPFVILVDDGSRVPGWAGLDLVP